jgi:hypothetical protein
MNQKLDKTIKWLYRNGRPLDVARYEYLFHNTNKELVERALKSYQNSDGGFGHGLEPDSQNPFSSPIQTWMAMEVIEELGLDNKNKIVKNVLDYLINKAPRKDGLYPATISTNNFYPHASWWTHSPEGAVWGFNPTIAIAGFIYKHAVDASQKQLATELIQKGINSLLDNPSNNMHEIRAYLEMVNIVTDLSKFSKHQEFLDKLLEQIDYNIEKNTSLWFKTYCVRPLQFFDKPNLFGYEKFSELAKLEAGMILENLNNDGFWDITWSWDNYKEAEAIAKRDWQSSIIIGYLKILKAYDIN